MTDSNFERVTNRRFGFYTYCPKAWDLLNPENGDGFSCHPPRNPSVEVSMYGSYLWQEFIEIDDGEPDFSDKSAHDVVQHRLEVRQDSLVEIIDHSPSGVRVDDYAGTVTDPQFEDRMFTVRGRRIEYLVNDEAGSIFHVLEKVGIYQGTVYTIVCEAPADQFEAYRPLFQKMVGDFHILTTGHVADG